MARGPGSEWLTLERFISFEEYNKSVIRIDIEENYVKKNQYILKRSKKWTYLCDQGPHTVDGECKVIFKSFDNNKKMY